MFINRQAEVAFLSAESTFQQERSRLIIVSGGSGVGKSALVDHCLERELGRKHFIVLVENHPRNKDEDRLFLTRLAGSMIQVSKLDPSVPSLPAVLQQIHQGNALRSFCSSLAKHFGSKLIGEEAFGVLESVATAITAGTKDVPEMITPELELYIQEVVSRVPSLIKIENTQLIDRRSHAFFLNLFSQSKNALGIFEVTVPSIGMSAEDLAHNFAERQIVVRSLSVKRLPLDDIVYDLSNRPQQVVDLISRSYNDSDGNLHPLQVLTTYSDKGWAGGIGDLTYAGLTKRFIEGMPRSEQVLLAAIVTHAGAVNEGVIRALFASPNSLERLGLLAFDFEDTLDILITKSFLAKGNDIIRTRHDSIIEIVARTNQLQSTIIALDAAWRDFYQFVRASGNDFFLPMAEVLDWLTYFTARLQDTAGTLRCLEDIGRLSFNSVAPRRLLEYLAGIRERIARLGGDQAQSTLRYILRQQALLLYEAGWFEEALECVDPN